MRRRARALLIAVEMMLVLLLLVLLVGVLNGGVLGPSEGLMEIEPKVLNA
jgi:hypothetical protein